MAVFPEEKSSSSRLDNSNNFLLASYIPKQLKNEDVFFRLIAPILRSFALLLPSKLTHGAILPVIGSCEERYHVNSFMR